jgi:hypothetical protein
MTVTIPPSFRVRADSYDMVKLAAEKRSLIIAMLRKFPGRSNAEIGRKLDVAASTVLSVKKKAEAQINGEFYVQRLSKKSVIDLIKVCRDALYDRAPATTKVRDDDALQQISTHLLNRHRVKSVRFAKGSEDSAKLKKRLVNQYGRESFQGFWIHDRNDLYDKATVDKFLARLDDPINLEKFTAIFEYTQDAPDPSSKKRKQPGTKESWRFGDGGRMHWRWNELDDEYADRLAELDREINKTRRELETLRARISHFEKLGPEDFDKRTRATASTVQSNRKKEQENLARICKLEKELVIAEKAHATYTEDRLLADKVKVILCDNYNSIMLHSPYAELGVECTINELRLLSIILSKPKTGSQTFHGDSPKRGCSLLMSAGRRQYLTVLLNSFKAMRSLDRMLPKRTEALEYVRARLLAAETPDGESAAWDDSEWDEKAEIRVWNYLCCLQFEHEKIGAIQAVLVPIEEGETLVVDNRTLHGGTRGGETRGFRFHSYGYVRDVRQRKAGFEKDEDITIDPLDVQNGYYPVCRWAQTRSTLPVFSARLPGLRSTLPVFRA